MKIFEKLFGKKELDPVANEVVAVKPKRTKKKKISDKDQATAKGEPYIRVIETHLNPNNPSQGFFELDWNSIFIDELRKAGYNANTEEEIIDKWFKNVCQNVIDESEANKEIRVI